MEDITVSITQNKGKISFNELSKMDQLKVDAIIRKAHDYDAMIRAEIILYKDYIQNYKLSDDVKKYLEDEIEYHEKILKVYSRKNKKKY